MKKLLFVFGIVLLLGSCEKKSYYSVSITNKTDKTVTYIYNGLSESLAPLTSKTYEVEPYSLPPTNYKDHFGIASININTDNLTGNYFFTNADFFYLEVISHLKIDATLKADNFLFNENGYRDEKDEIENYHSVLIKYSDEPDVEPEEEEEIKKADKSLRIYSKNPNFTVSSSLPVISKWTPFLRLIEKEPGEEEEIEEEIEDEGGIKAIYDIWIRVDLYPGW